MPRILCFGDSLTWGYDPGSTGRFPVDQVWPAVMGRGLAEHGIAGVTVIDEGLPGRTTVFDSPYAEGRNGATFLGPLLETHAPVDLVIIMLGTNDLQEPLNLSARHAASGLWTLIDIAHRSACGPDGGPPRILAACPPHLLQPSGFMGVFYERREAESRELSTHYQRIAQRAGVAYFDAATVVDPGAEDGVHLDQAGQAGLGEAMAERVEPLLR